jgi:hypothetical protein
MDLPLELHISDAIIFRDCRRRWFLGSRNVSNMEPNMPMQALWLGTGVHLALEMYAGCLVRGMSREVAADNMIGAFEDWANAEIAQIREANFGLTPEQNESVEGARDMGLGILAHYAEWAPEADAKDRIEYLQTEVPFHLQVTDRITLAGRIDGIVKAHGKLWVLENKTIGGSITTEHLLLDEQAGAYVLAARRIFGGEVSGVMYNFLRKKVPAYPETLASGGLSKRKNIDTTFEIYLQAIVENKLDPSDYADILATLKQKGNVFFRREFIQRTPRELQDLEDRLIRVGEEMIRAYDNSLLYPSPGKLRCRMCTFVPVCLAMAEGADWRYILNVQYRKKPEERAGIDWNDED